MPAGSKRSAAVLLGLLLLLSACGDRPERLEKGSQPPTAATAPKNARFAGTVILEGELSHRQAGALFVSARRKGQRLPTLSRKYEWQDAAWSTGSGRRELHFVLTDADNMGGYGAPIGAEMEVEARYSPSGFIDPKPGSEEAGSVRASVPATIGDSNLRIQLVPK
jgi:hypothetical protein